MYTLLYTCCTPAVHPWTPTATPSVLPAVHHRGPPTVHLLYTCCTPWTTDSYTCCTRPWATRAAVHRGLPTPTDLLYTAVRRDYRPYRPAVHLLYVRYPPTDLLYTCRTPTVDHRRRGTSVHRWYLRGLYLLLHFLVSSAGLRLALSGQTGLAQGHHPV